MANQGLTQARKELELLLKLLDAVNSEEEYLYLEDRIACVRARLDLKGGDVKMDTQERLDMYLELFESVREKVGDQSVAAAIVDQIGKDMRVERRRADRDARHAARAVSGEVPRVAGGDTPATAKQLDWLRDLGVRVPQNLTKARASEMLDETLTKQAAR